MKYIIQLYHEGQLKWISYLSNGIIMFATAQVYAKEFESKVEAENYAKKWLKSYEWTICLSS